MFIFIQTDAQQEPGSMTPSVDEELLKHVQSPFEVSFLCLTFKRFDLQWRRITFLGTIDKLSFTINR